MVYQAVTKVMFRYCHYVIELKSGLLCRYHSLYNFRKLIHADNTGTFRSRFSSCFTEVLEVVSKRFASSTPHIILY